MIARCPACNETFDTKVIETEEHELYFEKDEGWLACFCPSCEKELVVDYDIHYVACEIA